MEKKKLKVQIDLRSELFMKERRSKLPVNKALKEGSAEVVVEIPKPLMGSAPSVVQLPQYLQADAAKSKTPVNPVKRLCAPLEPMTQKLYHS